MVAGGDGGAGRAGGPLLALRKAREVRVALASGRRGTPGRVADRAHAGWPVGPHLARSLALVGSGPRGIGAGACGAYLASPGPNARRRPRGFSFGVGRGHACRLGWSWPARPMAGMVPLGHRVDGLAPGPGNVAFSRRAPVGVSRHAGPVEVVQEPAVSPRAQCGIRLCRAGGGGASRVHRVLMERWGHLRALCSEQPLWRLFRAGHSLGDGACVLRGRWSGKPVAAKNPWLGGRADRGGRLGHCGPGCQVVGRYCWPAVGAGLAGVAGFGRKMAARRGHGIRPGGGGVDHCLHPALVLGRGRRRRATRIPPARGEPGPVAAKIGARPLGDVAPVCPDVGRCPLDRAGFGGVWRCVSALRGRAGSAGRGQRDRPAARFRPCRLPAIRRRDGRGRRAAGHSVRRSGGDFRAPKVGGDAGRPAAAASPRAGSLAGGLRAPRAVRLEPPRAGRRPMGRRGGWHASGDQRWAARNRAAGRVAPAGARRRPGGGHDRGAGLVPVGNLPRRTRRPGSGPAASGPVDPTHAPRAPGGKAVFAGGGYCRRPLGCPSRPPAGRIRRTGCPGVSPFLGRQGSGRTGRCRALVLPGTCQRPVTARPGPHRGATPPCSAPGRTRWPVGQPGFAGPHRQ